MDVSPTKTFENISHYLKQQQALLGKTELLFGVEPATDAIEEIEEKEIERTPEIPVVKFDEKKKTPVAKPESLDKQKQLQLLIDQLNQKYPKNIFGNGSTQPKIVFVTGMPSPADIAAQRIISGKSVEVFARMLKKLGFKMDEIYVTSLLKYSAKSRQEITEGDLKFGADLLKAQVAILNPRYMFCLGEFVAQQLAQTSQKMDALRQAYFIWNEKKVFVTHHPFELIKDQQLFWHVFDDMKLFRSNYDKEIGDRPPMT